jgi:outer membrane receptor protein involved in Fe transport
VGNDITEANPLLQPEKLYGAETALGWKNDSTQVEGTVFYNQIDDAVTNVTVGVGPGVIPGFEGVGSIPAGGVLRQRRNAGTIKATGVEASATQRYSEKLSLTLAASYTRAKVDGGTQAPQLTGLVPAQAPRLTTTAQVSWRPTPRVSFDIRGRYEGRRFEDDQNIRKLHANGAVDLRAAFQVAQGAEIYATVDNASNEAIQTGQTADGVYSYGQPRTVSIGFNIRH